MRIGIAQLNGTVGDLHGNLALSIDAYEQLRSQNVDLIVYPELFLSGYPPRDLLFKERFLQDVNDVLIQFAKEVGPTPALIGFPQAQPEMLYSKKCFNAAAWCENGEVRKTFHKRLLPTYDVFDEERYFLQGSKPFTIIHKEKKIAVTICEDIWNMDSKLHENNPLPAINSEKPDILINLSASPWHTGKQDARLAILRNVVKKIECPVCYVNSIGGNDELVFDGRSLSMNRNGTVIAQSNAFDESLEVHDLSDSIAISERQESTESDLEKALVLGLRDYVHKTGFSKGLIGLSGGIDSAVTAVLAVKALGKDNVIGISLPSEISSDHSKEDARILAQNLGIEFHTLPIQSLVNSATLELNPLFDGLRQDVTEENMQARARGPLLMAVSNKFGALLLTTGNKSELAVGYCTLYGDMCGGLAVIADLPKTQVFSLARYINTDEEIIPFHTIDKPPSAELRPDQVDSDSLPPYEELDSILHAYVEEGKSIDTIVSNGHQLQIVERIVRLVDLNEYKRKQSAPTLKTTPLAFGVGRRMPVVQKYKN